MRRTSCSCIPITTKKKKNQSDDEEDFNDYAQDYVGEVEEDDADS